MQRHASDALPSHVPTPIPKIELRWHVSLWRLALSPSHVPAARAHAHTQVPIELEGTYGVLPHLERVLKVKGRAVVIVAEGAGEELCAAATTVDAGGNKALPEIGPFIKARINEHFKAIGTGLGWDRTHPLDQGPCGPSHDCKSVC